MSTKLTPKQERFAQLIATGLNQSDAYRATYDAKRMKATTVHRKAKFESDKGKIRARVEELRAPVVAEIRYTLKEAMGDAEIARRQALELGQSAAAVSAATLKAKLNGLLVEERRNERPPYEDLTDDELDRAIAETERAISRAQGGAAPKAQQCVEEHGKVAGSRAEIRRLQA